ncbi:MAG: amino acid ABC transporter permease [Desulfobacter sp.]|nr:MAG: amino acid ABC transporter permease [Desulfobacter sp.]
MVNRIYMMKRRAAGILFILVCLAFFPATAPAQEPDPIFVTANNLIAAGEYQTAIDLVMTVPEPGPGLSGADFSRSRMLAASLFHALEDIPRARAACEQVLAVFPDHVEAKNFLSSLAQEQLPFYQAFYRDCKRFLPALLKGAVMTLCLTLCTMMVSPLGGLFIALGRISSFSPLAGLCWFIIWFFRGTPLLLQLFFIYYGLPSLGITLSPVTAAVIGLSLNYSAYLAEIIRAGIQSIGQGQMEAAKALGMNYAQAMRRIIVPQTYKRILPPVGNEFIALIKDTALVSTIAMVELMRSADQIFNTYFNVNVLIIAAMIYLGFTTVFTLVFERVERKVGAYENR